jgi:hypothetical protein
VTMKEGLSGTELTGSVETLVMDGMNCLNKNS